MIKKITLLFAAIMFNYEHNPQISIQTVHLTHKDFDGLPYAGATATNQTLPMVQICKNSKCYYAYSW